jgi:YD repeat-containing protein
MTNRLHLSASFSLALDHLYGNIRWTRDPLGMVAYYGYHPVTTQRTLTVRDIDTASLPTIVTTDTDNLVAWNGNVPFARKNSLSTAFNQTTTTEYDKRGRFFATTNPDGVTSYTVSDVKKTIHFSAWDTTTTQQSVLPIDVIERNAAGKILESYQLPPTVIVVTNGKPSSVSASAAKVTRLFYVKLSKNFKIIGKCFVENVTIQFFDKVEFYFSYLPRK